MHDVFLDYHRRLDRYLARLRFLVKWSTEGSPDPPSRHAPGFNQSVPFRPF